MENKSIAKRCEAWSAWVRARSIGAMLGDNCDSALKLQDYSYTCYYAVGTL